MLKNKYKLKPCPFCGVVPEIYQTDELHFVIWCECLQAHTLEYHTPKEVMEAWNNRAYE